MLVAQAADQRKVDKIARVLSTPNVSKRPTPSTTLPSTPGQKQDCSILTPCWMLCLQVPPHFQHKNQRLLGWVPYLIWKENAGERNDSLCWQMDPDYEPELWAGVPSRGRARDAIAHFPTATKPWPPSKQYTSRKKTSQNHQFHKTSSKACKWTYYVICPRCCCFRLFLSSWESQNVFLVPLISCSPQLSPRALRYERLVATRVWANPLQHVTGSNIHPERPIVSDPCESSGEHPISCILPGFPWESVVPLFSFLCWRGHSIPKGDSDPTTGWFEGSFH